MIEILEIEHEDTSITLYKVNGKTRAGSGRNINCPDCYAKTFVYHFSWSALQCFFCKSMIDKHDWWIITKNKFKKNERRLDR